MVIKIKTYRKTDFVDITGDIQNAVTQAGVEHGICMVYVPHTTAAVTINESADPSVKSDILAILNQVIPWDHPYGHMEGNSPAHIKSTLVGASEMIAIENGRLVLGTWQGIFFCEFDGPRTRSVRLTIIKSAD